MSEPKSKSAIDAPRATLYMVDPSNVVIPGLDTQVGPTDKGGLLYDERAVQHGDKYKALVRSIYKSGVHRPILVRKTEDAIEVIDGRQRTKACRDANAQREKDGLDPHRVPVMLKRGADDELVAMSIEANELAEADTPLNRARKAERYVTLHGKTEKEAAAVFGVEAQTIRSWRSLLTLPDRMQKAVESGKLTASAAVQVASLKSEEDRTKAFDELVVNGGGTARARHVVDTAKKAARGVDTSDTAPPVSRGVLRKLVAAQKAGTIELDEAVIDTIRWVLGEITSRKINGLGASLRVLKLE